LWKWKFKKWHFFENWILKKIWEIKVDLIFNRDDKWIIPEISDCKILNNQKFDKFCLDKDATAKFFKNISPKSDILKTYENFWEKIIEFWLKNDDLVVLKENYNCSWVWIFIKKVSEIKKDLYPNWNWILIQEYIDTSVGIEWITKWKHDLRINVVDWKITNVLLRIPKKWSFLANILMWWKSYSVEKSKLPKSIIKLFEKIKKDLEVFDPKIVWMDFINSKNWFKLVELNSKPWILHKNFCDDYYLYNDALFEILLKEVFL
jgi:glutathione synthase/RimK-type ligase-like ATP-grasp enzyme